MDASLIFLTIQAYLLTLAAQNKVAVAHAMEQHVAFVVTDLGASPGSAPSPAVWPWAS